MRKRIRAGGLATALVAAALALAGCSTPGPLHLYSITPGASEVDDVAPDANDATQSTPSYLDGDTLTGFAYDPFTDHFFLRLAPGNHIRVVDRPARKIKREFDISNGPTDVGSGGGDLAVSPRDGHLFLVDPSAPQVIETTRLAAFVRVIRLQGRAAPAEAVAYDMEQNRLLVLDGDGRRVEAFAKDGVKEGELRLAQRVQPSLAFDAGRREFYAPLASPDSNGTGAIAVFDASGRLVRTLSSATSQPFIDVGPHSFLRMF